MKQMFENRCADCSELSIVKGQWVCKECFNQCCADVDDCPLGVTAEEVESASKVDKEYKLCAQSEDKPVKKTRGRTPNWDKLAIMSALRGAIPADGEIEIVHAERELLFTYNGIKYKLTLAVPRK